MTPIDLLGPFPSFTIRWTGLNLDVPVATVFFLTSENPGGAVTTHRFERNDSAFTMTAGSGTRTATFTSHNSSDNTAEIVPNRLLLFFTGVYNPVFSSLTITINS